MNFRKAFPDFLTGGFSRNRTDKTAWKITSFAVVGTALGFALMAGPLHAAAPGQCELKHPVRFAGLNWESVLILTEIERFIVEKGYGCKTDVIPTDPVPALAALERGDIDVVSEVWLNTYVMPWAKAEKSGKVKRAGRVFTGTEGWFIPRYTAERLPGLRNAADLAKYKEEFKDPEDPQKGRFYGCTAGANCQVVNVNLHKAFKLTDAYTIYSPGSVAAQRAAIMSAYQRKRNVVFYHWAPTSLVGLLDLVQLEFPPYNAEAQACLTDVQCKNPKPSAYPENPVFAGVSSGFSKEAPQLMAFLEKVSIPLPAMNEALARMDKTGEDGAVLANWFLKGKQEVWLPWVPAEVAARVNAALK